LKSEFNEHYFQLKQTLTQCNLFNAEEVHAFNIPFSDVASGINASLVFFVSRRLGISKNILIDRLKTLPVISMRLELIAGVHGNTLVNDAYNLDQNSLAIGLQFLAQQSKGKTKALILGEVHRDKQYSVLPSLAKMQALNDLQTIIYIGPKNTAAELPFITKQFDSLEDFIRAPVDFENTHLLITGTRSSHLEKIVDIYTEKTHVTRLEINLSHLRHNLNKLKSTVTNSVQILAMVKAQSYGVGLAEMAKFLEQEKIDYLGVAYADEGVSIRKAGVKTPILVMNAEPRSFDSLISFDLEPSIYSIEQLNALIHALILKQIQHFPIHLKLETGMHRLGFEPEQLNELIDLLNNQPEVYVKSVFSHLAAASDKREIEFTQHQFAQFDLMVNKLTDHLGYSFTRHISNTDGLLTFPEQPYEMVRIGIGLFGLQRENRGYEQVLTLKSKISQVKQLKKGDSVGYSRSFIAKGDMTIATVPVGYADGLNRSLSNGKWSFYIQGKTAPIVGTICMDMCMIDITDIPVQAGEDVEIFGSHQTIEKMSQVLATIPYEIISGISTRVHRVYIED
jgi:alanine racemase